MSFTAFSLKQKEILRISLLLQIHDFFCFYTNKQKKTNAHVSVTSALARLQWKCKKEVKKKTGHCQFNKSCPVHLAYLTEHVYVQHRNIKSNIKRDNKVSHAKMKKKKSRSQSLLVVNRMQLVLETIQLTIFV